MTYRLNPFPELETERLLLRQLKDEDKEKIFLIRSDKTIAEYLDRPLCRSITEAGEFIEKVNRGISNNESAYWGIFLKASK
jgi:[ribosomal protein S5]-alanine N-acetyltransferase